MKEHKANQKAQEHIALNFDTNKQKSDRNNQTNNQQTKKG